MPEFQNRLPMIRIVLAGLGRDKFRFKLIEKLVGRTIRGVQFTVPSEAGEGEIVLHLDNGESLTIGVTDEALTLSCRLVIDSVDTRDFEIVT
jgi:hypothetical protein